MASAAIAQRSAGERNCIVLLIGRQEATNEHRIIDFRIVRQKFKVVARQFHTIQRQFTVSDL